jgi:hypothetical protein
MGKRKTIDSFFKKKDQVVDATELIVVIRASVPEQIPVHEDEPEFADPISTPHVENVETIEDESAISSVQDFIKGDPALRRQIWACPADKQDEIRKAYIQIGPYQPKKDVYPSSGENGHKRRFQHHWFGAFSWLEYSPIKDAAFCFPCFLFSKKPKGKCGSGGGGDSSARTWRFRPTTAMSQLCLDVVLPRKGKGERGSGRVHFGPVSRLHSVLWVQDYPSRCPAPYPLHHRLPFVFVHAGCTVLSTFQDSLLTVACQNHCYMRATRTVQISGSSGPGSQNSPLYYIVSN